MDALDRTLQPTRRTLGDVDPAQPLDTTHPLLRGVQGFWLPLPHLVGGSRLYDLSTRSRNASIIGNTTEWVNTVEGPALTFDDTTNDRVEVESFDYSTPSSVTIVVRASDPTGDKFQYFFSHGDFFEVNSLHIYFDELNQSDGELNAATENKILTVKEQYADGNFHVITYLHDGDTASLFVDGIEKASQANSDSLGTQNEPIFLGLRSNLNNVRRFPGEIAGLFIHKPALSAGLYANLHEQIRRGFPDLLNRRDSVGLLGGGGGPSPISGTAAITDAQEQISATGQAKVSGTLSVTDGNETLTVDGATKISGTTSITDAVETVLASGTADVQGDFALTDSGEIITASGSVITTGAVSITDAGEIISAVSSLQQITGTAQITDAGEQIDATGEVKIAGTAILSDGTEEVIIVGENDITGSLSFADLAAEIAAEGAVEVQGSLALTDLGESISARERVPARLARVNVRLEDIIVVHATLEDALTVDAKLTD